ncbi:MAG: LamG domain-containing protein [Bacteroidota bacterium]
MKQNHTNCLIIQALLLFMFLGLNTYSQCTLIAPGDSFHIPTDSLEVYVSFDQNYLDQSGNGYHPVTQFLTSSAGICGNAGNFTSSNAKMTFPNAARLKPLKSYSISVWLKTSITSRMNLIDQRTGSWSPDLCNFTWYINSNYATGLTVSHHFNFPGYVNTVGQSAPYDATMDALNSNVSDGEWHHYVLVKNVEETIPTLKIYEDGCLISSRNIENADFVINGSLILGQPNSGSLPFNGHIDEFRIYKKALSKEEIHTLFRSCKPLMISDVQLPCPDSAWEVCISHPQSQVTYSIVNDLGQVLDTELPGCGESEICLTTSNFSGDSLFLQVNDLFCTRRLSSLDQNSFQTQFVQVDTTICTGDTILFNGSLISTPGSYTFLTNNSGCQTQTTLDVVVQGGTVTSIDTIICDGDVINYNGLLITSAGSYTFVDQILPCPGRTQLNVTVIPVQFNLVDTTICPGDTLMYLGSAITDSGTYSFSTNPGDCPEQTTLRVDYSSTIQRRVDAVICPGDSLIAEDGTVITTTSVYTALLNSAFCIKKITYSVEVLADSQVVDTTLCPGDTLIFSANEIITPGVYSITAPHPSGCDLTTTYRVTECLVNIEDVFEPSTKLDIFQIQDLYRKGKVSDYQLFLYDAAGRKVVEWAYPKLFSIKNLRDRISENQRLIWVMDYRHIQEGWKRSAGWIGRN